MKYSAILLFVAGALAIPQEASSITSAPASAPSVSYTPQVSCALACDAGDVTCQAACLGIARPNSSQAVETTKCAERCDQGNGSAEDTQKYSDCVQACISQFFPSSQTASIPGGAASNAASAGATGSGAASGSGASRTADGTGAEETGSSSATGSAAGASGTGAASANAVHIFGAGLAGLMAVFAL